MLGNGSCVAYVCSGSVVQGRRMGYLYKYRFQYRLSCLIGIQRVRGTIRLEPVVETDILLGVVVYSVEAKATLNIERGDSSSDGNLRMPSEIEYVMF